MPVQDSSSITSVKINPAQLKFLACPVSGEPLRQEGAWLVSESGEHRYPLNSYGFPLFAKDFISPEAEIQKTHYDRVASDYLANLDYSHTQEYMRYLDTALMEVSGKARFGAVAEICCGSGEALSLFGDRMDTGVGVDISPNMLESARAKHPPGRFLFVQGDATRLPLIHDAFDSVFMLGGIHHIKNRLALFNEIYRILKPGGRFFWREPVDDFFLWRWIRKGIYKISLHLDHETEHPLRRKETLAVLGRVGFRPLLWKTYGFLGFCLFMNSDVLIFNRLFRFIPGIRGLTRFMTRVDSWTGMLPRFADAGLLAIGSAVKPGGKE